MLKIFRNIRRNLIARNRFTSYMLYAIGEIILVVIGILIALQVNNWNENRKTLKKEQQYLERLHENLEKDSNMYALNIDFYKKVLEKGSLALSYVDHNDLSGHSYWDILVAFFQASQIWPVISEGPTYEELKSAGELSLIQVISLRNELSYYYTGGQQRYRETIGINPPYRKMVREIIPFEVQNYMWENCHRTLGNRQELLDCDPAIPEAESKEILEEIKANKEVIGELRFWMSSIKAGWVPLKEQKLLCDQILADINKSKK